MKNAFVTKRMFRNQNEVGLTRYAGPQSQVTSVPAHDFNNLHPTVRTGRCARALDHFRYVTQSGIEAKRVIGTSQIFINGLGDSDNVYSTLRKFGGYTKCIFAAADDESIQSEFFKILNDLRRSILRISFIVHLPEWICSR